MGPEYIDVQVSSHDLLIPAHIGSFKGCFGFGFLFAGSPTFL